jgi:hypothetical protein
MTAFRRQPTVSYHPDLRMGDSAIACTASKSSYAKNVRSSAATMLGLPSFVAPK